MLGATRQSDAILDEPISVQVFSRIDRSAEGFLSAPLATTSRAAPPGTTSANIYPGITRPSGMRIVLSLRRWR